ncbi:hypothetical protein ACIA8G_42385 [Lentzea sp. NPDC051213]|uniref:hypothetical protein n=1 Tax=Lentzea sp. NPDC051213 TaxID=3364126 RepID=UPI0037A1510E
MNNLERRYRTLLKVLPRWYRQDREEEMVGLFLAGRTDELDLEHSWPGWGETFAMLGLAVRTRFAAVGEQVWLGEVVRAVGVLGMLLGLTYVVPSVYRTFAPQDTPVWTIGWLLWALAPLVAFGLLLGGRRTAAKVVSGLLLMPLALQVAMPGTGFTALLYQLPHVVTFACLCLGFHRDAPAPPARRLAWWGGGALVLGLAEMLVWGSGGTVIAVAVFGVRVFALVRGDFVLGRALSIFGVLLLGPLAIMIAYGPRETAVFAVVAAALLVVSAAAPVRRVRVPGFPRP